MIKKEILEWLDENRWYFPKIAEKYNISIPTIYKILSNPEYKKGPHRRNIQALERAYKEFMIDKL